MQGQRLPSDSRGYTHTRIFTIYEVWTFRVSQRWVPFAAGRSIGPVILYWGELAVFAVLGVGLWLDKAATLVDQSRLTA